MLFGCARLKKIRKMSEGLATIGIDILERYSNSFVTMLHDNLPKEFEQELKGFLSRKINYEVGTVNDKEGGDKKG